MLNQNLYPYELMEPWAYNLAAGVLLVIQIFGLTLNLFVIILMCRDTQVYTIWYSFIEIYNEKKTSPDLESHQHHYFQFSLLRLFGFIIRQSVCFSISLVSPLDIW